MASARLSGKAFRKFEIALGMEGYYFILKK
jgi:hypothetical protein